MYKSHDHVLAMKISQKAGMAMKSSEAHSKDSAFE